MQGVVYGDYEILDTLGEGAAGVAYRARDTRTGETVALKVLLDQHAQAPELQNRFVREVGVLEKLTHPGIVAHRDCGIHEDQIYCVMEYVDSGSLADVLWEGGVLPWREAVEVATQVCAAIAYAHDHGVIHRDLKPANLFLTSDGHVKVGDFGLARDLNRHRLTDTGLTVGTCRFMAPEQVCGEDELTGAVDLYAVGCLLMLMTTGKCPFEGASVVEVFEHHLYTPPPRLDSLVPDCPQPLADLVDRLLAKDACERPADAKVVEQALTTILDGGVPVLAERECPEDEPNLTDRLHEKAAYSKDDKKTRYWPLAIAVALALAILGFLATLSK